MGYNRALCAPINMQAECQWFGKAKSCNSKCPNQYWLLTQNSHIAGESSGCQSGRYAKFCCRSIWMPDDRPCFDAVYPMADLLSGGSTSNNRRSESDFYYPYGEPCNAANLDSILRMETGWFDVGAQGEVVRQDHGYKFEPASSLRNNQRQSTRDLKGVTTTIIHEVTTRESTTRVCDGARTTQACHNYRSVIRHHPQWATLVCPRVNPTREFNRGWATSNYNSQHARAWSSTWIPSRLHCQRDEYPFARFWGETGSGYVRLIPGSDNGSGGAIANGVCPDELRVSTGQVQGGQVNLIGNRFVTTLYRTDTVTQPVLSISFINCNLPDDALTENPCGPYTLTSDPGFALLTQDPWYRLPGNIRFHSPALYRSNPPAYMTAGKTPPRRRDWIPDELIVDLGNSSRRASDEELFWNHGLIKCVKDDCEEELRSLGYHSSGDEAIPPSTEPKTTAEPDHSTSTRLWPASLPSVEGMRPVESGTDASPRLIPTQTMSHGVRAGSGILSSAMPTITTSNVEGHHQNHWARHAHQHHHNHHHVHEHRFDS